MQLAFTNLDEKSSYHDRFLRLRFSLDAATAIICHPQFMVLAVALETLQNCKVRPNVMANRTIKAALERLVGRQFCLTPV